MLGFWIIYCIALWIGGFGVSNYLLEKNKQKNKEDILCIICVLWFLGGIYTLCQITYILKWGVESHFPTFIIQYIGLGCIALVYIDVIFKQVIKGIKFLGKVS